MTNANYDCAGSGTGASDGLVCGGGVVNWATQKYDGTSWSYTNTMNIYKTRHGSCGTTGAALIWGGYQWSPGTGASAETYTETIPTWYPTGGSGYYESSGQEIGAPAKRYVQLEMTLTEGSSPQVPEITQEFGYTAGVETEDYLCSC